jgi:geranylgeranyl pyrophosphate synthase
MTSATFRNVPLRLQDLETFSNDIRVAIDQYILEHLVFPCNDDRQTLTESMVHSVRAGGKRIRPILTLLAYLLLDASPIKIIPMAAAIEMIHAYSLIHDDLPAMDNDAIRRGLPTCHIAFGEATAILAGDTLNTFAFELLAKQLPLDFPADRCLSAIATFAEACGINGMAGGQMLDLSSEGKAFGADHLRHIHSLKTGALIRACFTLPGILTAADQATMTQLSALGDAMGLLFQMVDDLLDEIGDSETVGKAVKKDSQSQKITYISVYGMTETQKKIEAQAELSHALLRHFEGRPSELLRDMITYLAKRST